MFTDLGALRRFSDLWPKYVGKKKKQKESEIVISHRTILLQKTTELLLG